MKSKICSFLLVFICIITLFSNVCYADLIDIPEWILYASQRAEELGISFDDYCEEYKEELDSFKNKIEEEEKAKKLEREIKSANEKGLTLEQYRLLEKLSYSFSVSFDYLSDIFLKIIPSFLFVYILLIFDFFILLLYSIYKYIKDKEKKVSFFFIFSNKFDKHVKKLIKLFLFLLCLSLFLYEFMWIIKDIILMFYMNNLEISFIIFKILCYFFIFYSIFLYFRKSIKNNYLKSYLCICMYMLFNFIYIFLFYFI